jgi:hypothetical protein
MRITIATCRGCSLVCQVVVVQTRDYNDIRPFRRLIFAAWHAALDGDHSSGRREDLQLHEHKERLVVLQLKTMFV